MGANDQPEVQFGLPLRKSSPKGKLILKSIFSLIPQLITCSHTNVKAAKQKKDVSAT